MIIKRGVSLQGLHISMRPVLVHAELIWALLGREEGVGITSGTEGTHSAGSLHYYGLALDLRTRYWDIDSASEAYRLMVEALPEFDVVLEGNHIHVENDKLAKKWALELQC